LSLPLVIEFDFESALELPKEEVRAFISELENKLKDQPQIDIPVEHYFANPDTPKGIYAREIKMDSGSLIVGKIHKLATINVISSGEVSVLSQDGVIRVKAPYTFVSTPGAKRVIYAHEPSTWTCFHATGETDVDKIEEEFIAKNYDEVLEQSEEQLCLG
jgi:hypothetical protein